MLYPGGAPSMGVSHPEAVDPDGELRRLEAALQSARLDLERVRLRVQADVGAEEAEIFAAHELLLEDPEFLQQIRRRILLDRVVAERAVQAEVADVAKRFAAIEDPYLRERSADFRDIEKAADSGNDRARLAIEVFVHRLKKYVGAYAALLGGADALLEQGYRPDIIVGDMDSVTERALRSGAEIVLHAYPGGAAPARGRVEALGLPYKVVEAVGTSEDVAYLLAHDKGADLIVAVGSHGNLREFLDKGREGMSSTFLVRLRIGPKLVDAKGVNRLYRPTVRTRDLMLLIAAALAAMLLFAYAMKIVRRLRGATAMHVYRGFLDRLSDLGANRRDGESRERHAQRVAAIAPSFVALTDAHLRWALGPASKTDGIADHARLARAARAEAPDHDADVAAAGARRSEHAGHEGQRVVEAAAQVGGQRGQLGKHFDRGVDGPVHVPRVVRRPPPGGCTRTAGLPGRVARPAVTRTAPVIGPPPGYSAPWQPSCGSSPSCSSSPASSRSSVASWCWGSS